MALAFVFSPFSISTKWVKICEHTEYLKQGSVDFEYLFSNPGSETHIYTH